MVPGPWIPTRPTGLRDSIGTETSRGLTRCRQGPPSRFQGDRIRWFFIVIHRRLPKVRRTPCSCYSPTLLTTRGLLRVCLRRRIPRGKGTWDRRGSPTPTGTKTDGTGGEKEVYLQQTVPSIHHPNTSDSLDKPYIRTSK